MRLFHSRFQQLEAMAGIAPASVNLILTDIPWGKDFLPTTARVGRIRQPVVGLRRGICDVRRSTLRQ